MADLAGCEITHDETTRDPRIAPLPTPVAWSPRTRPIGAHWCALRDVTETTAEWPSPTHATYDETIALPPTPSVGR